MAGKYADRPERPRVPLIFWLCINVQIVQASSISNFSSKLCTCRELLLAFVWLLVHESVLEHVFNNRIHQLCITSLLPPYPVVSLHLVCIYFCQDVLLPVCLVLPYTFAPMSCWMHAVCNKNAVLASCQHHTLRCKI